MCGAKMVENVLLMFCGSNVIGDVYIFKSYLYYFYPKICIVSNPFGIQFCFETQMALRLLQHSTNSAAMIRFTPPIDPLNSDVVLMPKVAFFPLLGHVAPPAQTGQVFRIKNTSGNGKSWTSLCCITPHPRSTISPLRFRVSGLLCAMSPVFCFVMTSDSSYPLEYHIFQSASHDSKTETKWQGSRIAE